MANSRSGSPSPDSLGALMASANAAVRAGRLNEADALCTEILSRKPTFPQAIFLQAIIATRRGHEGVAIGKLRSVLKIDPNAFEALEWLANLLRQAGKPAESEEICRRMIEQRPNHPGSMSSMGLCLLDQGNAQQAVPYLQRAAALAPTVAVFHYHLARALQEIGQVEDAIAALRAAISCAPSIAIHYEALGHLLVLSGRRKEGVKSLLQALEIEPTCNCLLQLGSALAEDGRNAEAEHYLRRAVETDPAYAPGYQALGFGLQVLGRFDEAIAMFEKAIELDGSLAGSYFGLVRSKKLTQADDAMMQQMERMIKERGRSDEDLRKLHYGLGKAYEDVRLYPEAMSQFKLANRYARQVQYNGKPFDPEAYEKWTDLLHRTFSKSFLEAHREVGSESEQPVLIIGMIRSGTTLVEQVLSSHPRVGAAGEVQFWTDSARTQLIQKLSGGWFDPGELLSAARDYLDQLKALGQNRDRITDKMPLNFMAAGLIHLLFPKARFIHCRRDLTDTALSIYTTPFDKGPEFCYDWKSIDFACREYLRLMAHWHWTLPSANVLEIDYEELVANREVIARRIIEFCGLEWDEACLRPEANERAVRTPSRWQVRQPVYRSSVGRWKRYELLLDDLLDG